MTDRASFLLFNAQQGHQALQTIWTRLKPYLVGGHRMIVEIKPETRTNAQNARLWAMLTDIAEQIVWHGQRLTPSEWKDMGTAALKRQKVVPGIDGGFVVLGSSTSSMTKAEFAELMEFLEAFGAQHGVRFSAPERD